MGGAQNERIKTLKRFAYVYIDKLSSHLSLLLPFPLFFSLILSARHMMIKEPAWPVQPQASSMPSSDPLDLVIEVRWRLQGKGKGKEKERV